MAILRILGAVSLTFARVRARMQKFAFKSPVNARWRQRQEGKSRPDEARRRRKPAANRLALLKNDTLCAVVAQRNRKDMEEKQ